MARLPYLSADDLDPADRDLLARNLNLYFEFAHSPPAARAFAAPALYTRHDSPLDARLRELAIIQIGYATKTAYEYAHHIELGLDVGLTEDDIHAVAGETRGESTHLTVVESAVLAAARQIVATPEIEDAVFEELRAGLGERCLVDLVMVISFYCAVVRFLGVFQIDLEPGYDRYLEQFPFASD